MLCSNGQKIKGNLFLLHNLTKDGGDADHKRLQRGGGRKLLKKPKKRFFFGYKLHYRYYELKLYKWNEDVLEKSFYMYSIETSFVGDAAPVPIFWTRVDVWYRSSFQPRSCYWRNNASMRKPKPNKTARDEFFCCQTLWRQKKLLQKNQTKKLKRIESWEVEFKDAGTNIYRRFDRLNCELWAIFKDVQLLERYVSNRRVFDFNLSLLRSSVV